MNIYILTGSTNYQIHPVPTDLTGFTLLEVPDTFNNTDWQVVIYNNEPLAVLKPAKDILFPIWNGSEWITDTDAQYKAAVSDATNKQKNLIATAKQEVIFYSSFGETEDAKVKAWQDYYSYLIKIDVTKAPNIDWGTAPH